jgi:Flp pilus assembly protein TadG
MISVWTKFRSVLHAFRIARDGNVAIIFALVTLPIIAAVGFAVDYSRANAVKVALQQALDATALMISKEATTDTADQLQTNAAKYFAAMFTASDAQNVSISATYTTTGGTSLVVTGSAQVPTTLLGVIGYNTLTVDTSATVKWGSNRLRVALVLDNTGSMADAGKMSALQSATKSLLSQLQTAASVDGDVYVSIIPFVKDVDLGSGNYNATYIDWTSWLAEPPYIATNKPSGWSNVGPGSSCPFSSWSYGFSCTTGPANGSSSTSTIPSSGSYSGYICPSIDNGSKLSLQSNIYYNGCYNSVPTTTTTTTQVAKGWGASCGGMTNCSCTGSGFSKVCTQTTTTTGAPYTHTWIPNATSTWNGCVVDRGTSSGPDTTNNYDTNAATPDTSKPTTLYSAEQYGSCPQAVMGLSYNWSGMTTLVNNMSPAGNTNQAIGLQLGWMSLVGGGPFTVPAEDPNYTYSHIIILLTDGLNTQDRWYTSQNSIDARQQLTCSNIKTAGITLYTIQVNTGGDPTSTLLQNCASTSDKFYLLTSASQIITAFTQIGTSLTQLRLAK